MYFSVWTSSPVWYNREGLNPTCFLVVFQIKRWQGKLWEGTQAGLSLLPVAGLTLRSVWEPSLNQWPTWFWPAGGSLQRCACLPRAERCRRNNSQVSLISFNSSYYVLCTMYYWYNWYFWYYWYYVLLTGQPLELLWWERCGVRWARSPKVSPLLFTFTFIFHLVGEESLKSIFPSLFTFHFSLGRKDVG